MALKYQISKEEYDNLHEVLQAEYEEGEGSGDDMTYILDGDMIPKSQLKEFRENNIALMKERDELGEANSKYKAFGTPDEIQEKLDAKGKPAKADPAITERAVAKARQEWEEEQAEKDAKHAQTEQALRKFQLEDKVRAAAVAGGVNEKDVEDVLILTHNNFDLDEQGEITVVDNDGDPYTGGAERFFKVYFKKVRPRYYDGSQAGGTGTEQGEVKSAGQVAKGATVLASDTEAIEANFDAIAAGEVTVVDG